MLKERIRELRLKNGFTQQEMADAIMITMRQYQNYEGGQAKPTIDGLLKIADFLQVSTDFLLGRDDYLTYREVSAGVSQKDPP